MSLKDCQERYRLAHPEKIREWKRAYYLRHKADILARNLKWFNEHPEARKKYRKTWKKKHWEIVLADARKQQKEARQRNPEKFRQQRRDDYKKHSDSYKARAKRFKQLNRKKCLDYEYKRRARKRENGYVNCSDKIGILQKERFCHWCCRPLNESNRSIDHVIPLSRGGKHVPDNLVAACKPCNCSKHNKLVSEWSWKPYKEAA